MLRERWLPARIGEGAGDMEARAFNTLSQWFDKQMTRPSSSNSEASRPVDMARTTRGLVAGFRRAFERSVGEVGGEVVGLEHNQTFLGHEDGLTGGSDLILDKRPLESSFSSTSRKIPRSAVALRIDSIGD